MPRPLSVTPGRVSLRYPPLHQRRALAAGIELNLHRLAGVRTAHASARTARVLVFFDDERLSLGEIVRAVGSAVPLSPFELTQIEPVETQAHVRGDRQRLVLGGSVLALLLAKRLLLGAGLFSGNPLLIAISAGATIVSGYPFLRGGLRSLTGKQDLDTDALIATATIASLLLQENVTALIVIWLLNLGEYLQALTVQRVHRAIEGLLTGGETEAWLVVEGIEVRSPVGRLERGDVVAVYTGETIPVDGVVLSGSGSVNEAPITGESLPVYKNPADSVFAGTIVEAGSLRVRAEQVGANTAVGRLIQRIEQAQELRAPIETVAQGFSRRFVPLSFLVSLAVLALTRDVRRAMTMLVIACPCAAGLSTPTAVSAAIGNAARRGVLVKGGVHLEAAAAIDTVVFDKTGTLTTGRARVSRVLSLARGRTAEQVLEIAASGELHSRHPLALAVLRHSQELEVVIPEHEECEVLLGRGMRADMGGNQILVGSDSLLREFGVPTDAALTEEQTRLRAEGETILCVAVNREPIGLIGVRDFVRPEAAQALAQLRALGVERFVLLTGDSPESAELVARELRLDEYIAEVLPEQKHALVTQLQAEGRKVAMIGDGINDGPALARADLGIAMGTAGSDLAIEAADVALARDDLRDVARVLALSRSTLSLVRQNYALSLSVNLAGLLMGAAGLLNPIMAAVLHNASTVSVVLNSSRLIAYTPPVLAEMPADTSRGIARAETEEQQ